MIKEKEDLEVYWPAVLSFILPGLGQVAKKKLQRGYLICFAWLVLTLFLYGSYTSYLADKVLTPGSESNLWMFVIAIVMINVHICAVVDTISEFKFEENSNNLAGSRR